MSINESYNFRRIQWYNREQLGQRPRDPDLRRLLFTSGSLTRRLRQHCGKALQLQLITQQWRRPWQEEQQLLGLSQGRYTLIREVAMTCRDVPWLYARTLLPPRALRGAARRFTTIGQRPLGALLFGAPGRLSVHRVQRDYAHLPTHSKIHERIEKLLPAAGTEELWARRTLYRTGSMHFVIIEVFLSAVTLQNTHECRHQ